MMELFIYSQTSVVQPMDNSLDPTLHSACDYFSMPGLKLSYVTKYGPWPE